MAINQINILGFKIEILNPCIKEIVFSFISLFFKFSCSLFKIDLIQIKIRKMMDRIFKTLKINKLVFIINPIPKTANVA